ncbi:MAG TPA: sugar ABC transporter substrate-binding protein [Anaerolineae bacterium]|nr:sugar ABC transporter substrate-binding protein [Anaerolineae bacterium]
MTIRDTRPPDQASLVFQGRPSFEAAGSHFLSRRAFLSLAGSAAAGAVLAACAPRLASSPGPHGSNIVQLVYQDWRTDWFSGMAQRMLDQFHAAHPNIHVFFTQDPDNLDEEMMNDFRDDTAPDVLAGCCDFFPAWAQSGYLLDLRPYVEADLDRGVIADWDAAQYKALFTADGLQFGLPKYHGALAVYYNIDLFDRYGVERPEGSWNHDDYLAIMRQLTRGRARWRDRQLWASMLDVSWERLQVHVNGWGGHFVDPADPTNSLMASPESLEALRWIRDRMWADRLMASPLDVKNLETRYAFSQGLLAMVEDGSWALKDILENAPFRVGVAPFPAGPARQVTLATTDGYGIYAHTKHPEAAWELLKFLVSRDYGRAMAQAHLLQPARASLVEEWAQTIRQQYPEQTREMNLEAFAAGHLESYSTAAEIFANMAPARSVAQAAWEQIFTLGQAPVSAMREVSARIEAAQQPAG